jgi:hypothetical protein
MFRACVRFNDERTPRIPNKDIIPACIRAKDSQAGIFAVDPALRKKSLQFGH